MKRRIVLMTVGLLSTLFRGYAQNYVVKDICELPSDLIARTEVRMDKNGHECAVVRVNIPSVKRMEFGEDAVVGKTLPGEYVLYVPENTQKLSYSIDENSKGIIDFSAFQIGLKGKCTYRCTLQRSDKLAAGKKGTLDLHTNIEGTMVFLDGEPIGEAPLMLSDIPVGKHRIGVYANHEGMYYARPDTIVSITEGQLLTISLQLKETEDLAEIPFIIYWGESGDESTSCKIIENNGKQGVIDLAGKVLVPCKYDRIRLEPFQTNYFDVALIDEDGRFNWGLYEVGKGLVVPANYGRLIWCPDQLQPTKHGDVSFVNASKRIVTDGKEEYKWGVYSVIAGKEITPFIYYNPLKGEFKEGRFLVGEKIIPNQRDIRYQYYRVEKNSLTEIPHFFSTAYGFSDEGFAMARLSENDGGQWAILNVKNFIEGEYTPIQVQGFSPDWLGDENAQFCHGLCPVRTYKDTPEGGRVEKWGAIDTKGQLVIPAIYDCISNFHDGVAHVRLGGKEFCITANGIQIDGSEYWEKSYSTKHYFIIKKNGKEGIVHRSGKIIVPCDYDECKILRTGAEYAPDYIKVEFFSCIKGNICDVYGVNGLMFVCPENCVAISYEEGFFEIRDEETYTLGFANAQGELIISSIFDDTGDAMVVGNYVSTRREGLSIVHLGNRYGFVDVKGEMVVPMDYIGAFPFIDGKAYVQKQDGKWIELDRKTINSKQQ